MTLRALLLAAALISSASPAALARAGTIHVAVKVQTQSGEPLPDVVVSAVIEGRRVVDGATSADGSVQLDVEAPDGLRSLGIQHGWANPSSVKSMDDIQRMSKAMNALRAARYLDRESLIQIDPARSDYALTITAWDGVSVTAKFIDEVGRPIQNAVLYGPGLSMLGGVDRGRVIPLRNVRKSAKSLVVARARVGQCDIVRWFDLGEFRTAQDVDLGDVIVTEPDGAVPIAFKATGDRALRSTFAYRPGMTLVSLDGKLIATFELGAGVTTPPTDGELSLRASDSWIPKLPPGEYVVAPGYFAYGDTQVALIRMLMQGIDLTKADLVRITVQKDGPNRQAVNLLEADASIKRLSAAQRPTS